MGRSVSYLNNSLHEVYIDVSDFDDSGFDWDDWVSNIKYTLQSKFKSLRECKNEWDGRETMIILDNSHCQIGVSEYCGLASVSIRINDSIGNYYGDKNTTGLAEKWINQVWDKMEKIIQDCSGKIYVKSGSFSNGEGVFNEKGSKEGFCHNSGGKTYEF